MAKTLIVLFFAFGISSPIAPQAHAGWFSPKPKESYVCRPDRRDAHLEVRVKGIEVKNGPTQAKLEIWNQGVRSQSEKGNAFRTDLEQKKFIVVATKKSQVSFDVSNKPYRGTLSITANAEGKEEELEITCERNP